MAQAGQQAEAVRFAGWEGGEWGTLGAEEAGRREAQMFTGVNVRRTADGLLGPRAGVAFVALSGVPADPVGGFGWAGTPHADLWVVIGNAVNLASTNGGPIRYIGALAATPTRPVQSVEAGIGLTAITVSGDQSYLIDHVAETLTPLPGSPGGDTIEVWGERLVVSGRDSSRIFFSEAADFSAWPADNWFDVGVKAPVAAIFAQRGHLTIGLRDGSWWVRTGVPGFTGELRRVSGGGVHPWHFTANAAAVLGSDQIAYVPVSADYPALFNGATPREERHLGLIASEGAGYGNGYDDIKAVRGFRPDEWLYILPDHDRFAQYRHGVWTHHLLPFHWGTPWVASDMQGKVYFCRVGDDGVPRVFVYRLAADRPARMGDAWVRPGDDSEVPLQASFSTPEWWHPDGREVRVRAIIADVVTTNIVSEQAVWFDVQVDALRRYVIPDAAVSAVQTWSGPPFDTNQRVHLGFGDQGRGGGFQIHVTNMVGVSVRSLTAVVDIWERRT